jgi:hypothetical protein
VGLEGVKSGIAILKNGGIAPPLIMHP